MVKDCQLFTGQIILFFAFCEISTNLTGLAHI